MIAEDMAVWRAGSNRPIPFIGGHRGASAHAHENSFDAFELAITQGADFIETDLRLTRDGIPVGIHDSDLVRLAGDTRSVGELDFDSLCRLHPATVRLDDALERLLPRISVLLDTKLIDAASLHTAFDRLAPHVQQGKVAFGTRSLDASKMVRKRFPDCPVLGLYSNYNDYGELSAIGGEWARLWQDDATPHAITDLHDLGMKVIVMAGKPVHGNAGVTTDHNLKVVMERGIDAVMLNDVTAAISIRTEKTCSVMQSSSELHSPVKGEL